MKNTRYCQTVNTNGRSRASLLRFIRQLMHIETVAEYRIPNRVHKLINRLLVESFSDYPLERSYYKLLPQFRYLVWVGEDLIAHMGIEHRVITIAGIPARIFGLIDLCVASSYQSQKIATSLLQQIEELGTTSGIDFLMLFADDPRLYTKNGYHRVANLCRWMMVDEHQTLGVGEESMSDCMMVKQIGIQTWQDGTVDLLGYLF
ncbi:GNAT family N-acetyltransferase [Gloeocapsopsis crepidinum LEGE 06123]|uniref:GNAT family N-acetyltransferase n=1 Tax=Gloeocapsopsis crepidinum LEGE 06123 TaxID=588587 RepID=A0ABR9UY72_9CHRO|nr:GNAT family N-acetyltransferase [Gloeocapsopsis crepidinum]MBE9193275.1 GNAT family N-acetyltransferase [Gloeocapsopsis crepidinum LEGE 06123]